MRDFNESELFYDQLMNKLGFKIDHIDQGDFGKMKSYKQNEHNLWIRFDSQKSSESFVRDVGLDHLAFELKTQIEIDEVYDLVKKLNVKITREPKAYPEYSDTYYSFYFRDPNEIPLEVYKQ